MRKYWAVLFVFVWGSVASAYALDTLRVNVPFDFIIGDVTLPAGEYTIDPGGGQGAIGIQNVHAKLKVYTLSNGAVRAPLRAEVNTMWTPGPVMRTNGDSNPPDNLPRTTNALESENSVVFHRYGDLYFISKVWAGNEGRQFPVSKQERAQIRAASAECRTETLAAAR